MNIEESIKLVYKAIDDKQGEDIKILKIGNISSLADYFIITSASNERQVKSITDNIEKELEEHGIFVRAKEGTSSSNWILLDYGDYIIHVFKTEDRQFYNLERLWKDAQEITVEAI
ncbi:ribosome-associated protein [Acetoanaerobium noterae]|jgi:ribosome-associated protein|uniref:Ribosomal silencing factor RsfS n=2 Tax=root TaxID=1 RepID=A0A1T5CII8_9FIRM|nr:ribosome silencing factor [Acetoanaerobium noterae]MBP8762659.1 ribosome silencing factor [Acetoanaerobium sp.]MDK2803532.1 ribosome-associated protein [Peptostreptococcaceae bacterium]MBP9499503.1 ribosome silencing factor [Acetoanaerobium sp.]MBP9561854.1 ribosome silencing factor [Acetoanaerobium sp.]SKB59244.1 ribosome-associated protein [Acetoanaerobium noterae]